jgi:hypothetical protein
MAWGSARNIHSSSIASTDADGAGGLHHFSAVARKIPAIVVAMLPEILTKPAGLGHGAPGNCAEAAFEIYSSF